MRVVLCLAARITLRFLYIRWEWNLILVSHCRWLLSINTDQLVWWDQWGHSVNTPSNMSRTSRPWHLLSRMAKCKFNPEMFPLTETLTQKHRWSINMITLTDARRRSQHHCYYRAGLRTNFMFWLTYDFWSLTSCIWQDTSGFSTFVIVGRCVRHTSPDWAPPPIKYHRDHHKENGDILLWTVQFRQDTFFVTMHLS